MKNKKLGLIIIAIGLIIIIYPIISNIIESHNMSIAIQNYKEQVKNMTEEEIQENKEKAREYNQGLIGNDNVKLNNIGNSEKNDEETEGVSYLNVLNIGEVIGYVDIPKISVYLPIYHGVSENVLQSGVGHVENSSFPIGEIGTHTVLAGHTGLVRTKLFDDIDKLQLGDKFYIHVLDEKLTYQVDQIKVVKPEDTKYVAIEEDKEYVTLLTCVPYGINTHRLLVRGTRVEDAVEDTIENNEINIEENIKQTTNKNIIIGIIIFVVSILLIFILKKVLNRKGKTSKH